MDVRIRAPSYPIWYTMDMYDHNRHGSTAAVLAQDVWFRPALVSFHCGAMEDSGG